MKLGLQALDLLKFAEDYRAEHCQTLLAKAAAEAAAILKTAHAAARRELRARLAPEHRRLAAEIAEAEAKLVTQRRLRDQRRVTNLLRQAWPRLEQALRRRWESPAGRAAWVAQHLAVALIALPDKAWVIRHPPDWPEADLTQASRWLQAHGITDAQFESEAGLQAGIRVVCGLNLLDASFDGLLADRAQIEGRLLDHLEQMQ